jgi:hypothetical protein
MAVKINNITIFGKCEDATHKKDWEECCGVLLGRTPFIESQVVLSSAGYFKRLYINLLF